MSVILRHKVFPLMVIFDDPEKNWDEIVKDRIIEEIKENGFDNFTMIDREKAKLFVEYKPTVKKTKTAKKNKKES